MSDSVTISSPGPQGPPGNAVTGPAGAQGPKGDKGDLGNNAFTPLKQILKDGQKSVAIQVLSDSTGVTTVRWPYLIGAAIGALYPAYTVEWRPWDDTTQDYLTGTNIQVGTAGLQYLDAQPAGQHTRVMPGKQPVTGNIDVRVKCSLADWTPTTTYSIAGRPGASPTFSWYFNVVASGALSFVYSTDGTTLTTVNSTASAGITDGTTQWIRAVFLHDNGSTAREFRFYKSSDGATWTQIGTTQTTAGVVSLFNPSAAACYFELGGRGTSLLNAKVYEVQIRDGENGASMVPERPDCWQLSILSGAQMSIVGAPVLTIVNGSNSGASLAAYLDDPVRLPKMCGLDFGQVMTLLSSSHNDGVQTGRTWWTNYTKWITDVQAISPNPAMLLTQNPELPASTNYLWHQQRARDLLPLGRFLNKPFIDTFQAFVDAVAAGTPLANLLADNVHPNDAGMAIWTSTIMSVFNSA